MRTFLSRLWGDTSGVLSFEWIALNSVVALGVISGMASVRDAINDEMADLTEAMTSLDQSYAVPAPLTATVHAPFDGGNAQRSFGGGGTVNPVVRVGEGYSASEWNSFVERYKDSGEILVNRGGGSGGGSYYVDRKPMVDRSRIVEGNNAPAPRTMMDESSLIEPENKQ